MRSARIPIDSVSFSTSRSTARTVVRCIRWGLLVTVLLLSNVPAWADYRIGAGDRLEISVVGLPELQRRTLVQSDGTISFPLLGTLTVAGQSLPDVRAQIKAALASKVYRQKTSGGAERAIVIGLNEITVDVAEYRPIYVKGGVARAGEYTYRLLMTVREAVALSGGYDILPVKVSNPYLATADFRGEYEALWLEFAKQQARVWRLKAELEKQDVDEDAVAQEIPIDAPISRAMIARIVALATDQYRTRRADYRRQESFLKQSIERMDKQIATMSHREEQEEKGADADAKNLERVVSLYEKGTFVHNRVIEARRNVLLSVTRRLQTASEVMQLKQQKIELGRQLDRLADERRMAVLGELEEATVRLGELRAKLQSVGEKLRYTATAKAQFTDSDRKKPVITVHRKNSKGGQRLVVDEAFELQPGDVIEVTAGP